MTLFILIRHGETDWNIDGRWQGQIDVPLNEKGIEQAGQIAQSLMSQKIDLIFSSDLSRARQTAEAIRNVTRAEITLDPRLREIHQGEWQGMLVTEIQRRYRQAFIQRKNDPYNVAPPGGETALDVQQRVVAFINEISKRYPNKTVVVVSHGFAIAVMIAHFKRIPIEKVWDLVPNNTETIIFETS